MGKDHMINPCLTVRFWQCSLFITNPALPAHLAGSCALVAGTSNWYRCELEYGSFRGPRSWIIHVYRSDDRIPGPNMNFCSVRRSQHSQQLLL